MQLDIAFGLKAELLMLFNVTLLALAQVGVFPVQDILSGAAKRIFLHCRSLHGFTCLPSPPNFFFPLQPAQAPHSGLRQSSHSPQRCLFSYNIALHSQQRHWPFGI